MNESVNKYLDAQYDQFVEELKEWLRMPSIGALSEYDKDVRAAAEWAEKKLLDIGFPKVEVIRTDRHPLVYAEWLGKENQPILLVYGHYDVQPVDPLEEWKTPPFEPVIKDGNIYCRGASDDKGQIMLVLAAIKAWVKVNGELPVNVKVLLEGEEESGGASVEAFVKSNSEKLKSDVALICDTHMVSDSQPSLTNGLRGILYTEINVHGPKRDLHSGTYGGVAPNPIHALCILLSRLKGEDGTIRIPELQRSIPEVSPEDKRFWETDPLHVNESLLEEMGVERLVGEENYPPLERIGARPTLEIHGIKGGFMGEGAKTVIPAEATAKVSFRLPAGMKPKMVFEWFKKSVDEHMPAGYRFSVRNIHGGEGVLVDQSNVYLQAAAKALEAVYGKEPVFMREGGSIPIASLFDSELSVPVVLMGFGLPDDGLHSPNEKFSLDQLKKGMKTTADFLERLKR